MNGAGMKYKDPKYFKAQGKESAYDAQLNIIDSLQQEQPKPSNNLVDVDAVREDFMREVYRILDADPTNDRANAIINAFDSLPTISQEQPELCKGWVARNRPNTSPSLVFFYDKPIRQDNGWGDKFWHSPNTWSEEISIPANLFPSLRWEDEPIEVEVVIRNARKKGK